MLYIDLEEHTNHAKVIKTAISILIHRVLLSRFIRWDVFRMTRNETINMTPMKY